jgi:flagellar motor switch protein FliM
MQLADLIDRFRDVPLEVSAAIAIHPMRVSEIVNLRAGCVLTTAVPADSRVQVFAGSARIGAGECSRAGSQVTVRLLEFGGGQ